MAVFRRTVVSIARLRLRAPVQ
eukprot:COSAG02_NODE_14868_length_1228_cov_1.066430_1_plen_21_part_10